jgi:hypothetical protein
MFARRVVLIGLVLGAFIHADWHFARPGHLGLDLRYHWLVTGLLFGLVGWFIARRWPAEWVRTAFFSLFAGVLFGQVLEPLYEAVFDEHRFGLAGSPERWLAFWQALAAGTLLYIGGLWLGQRRSSH